MSKIDRPWDEPEEGRSPFFKFAGIGALVLIGVIFVAAALGGDSEPEETHTEYGAEVVCEDEVADTFKSPDSADFSETVRAPSGTGWRITGTVDAENSFGASLRHDYSCLAVPGTEEGYWTVTVEKVTAR